jgi:hypothetical protein
MGNPRSPQIPRRFSEAPDQIGIWDWVALLAEQRKQQCQDDADEDGGGDGEVESKLLLFNEDISGKSAYPRYLFSEEQKKTHQNNKDTHQDKKLSEGT